MTINSISLYEELDPTKKTGEWMNEQISMLRRDMRSVVDINRAKNNRRYLLSTFDMSRVENMFKGENFKNSVDFIPVATFEKIRNIIISELTDNPPKCQIKAIDPSAIEEKKKDIQLLKNRKILEGDLTNITRKVDKTSPAYKVSYDNFSGNIEDFDNMGLKEGNPDDVSFFEKVYFRLAYETRGQSLINAVMKLNKFTEYIKNFVNDILAIKTICYQTYVSQLTGEIKYKYLYPEVLFGILGDKANTEDAVCKAWQDSVTIREFLNYVGNKFDWDRDWKQLLWALNYNTGNKYTGFIRNGLTYDIYTGLSVEGNPELATKALQLSNCCQWNEALNYRVTMGYIEWKSIDADTYKVKKTTDKSTQLYPVDYDFKETKSYAKESWYKEETYCSTYLATAQTSQYLYGWGKLYHQLSEGQNDEFSNFSLSIYREEGLSAVEIGKAYIDLANSAFYKMLWAVHEAKPDVDVYQYEELIELAKNMNKQASTGNMEGAPANSMNSIQALIDFFKENLVKIRAYPKVDGKVVPNATTHDNKERHGLDPIAIAMQSVVTWAENQISEKIGLGGLRSEISPQPRDGYKIQEGAAQASENATGYVPRMIEYLMNDTATVTTLLAQDIIQYKDTLPYNYILKLAGQKTIDAIKELGGFAAHRFGIFVRSYNAVRERQKIEQIADQAFVNKEITLEQYILILDIDDFTTAGMHLAYMKEKAAKKLKMDKMQEQNFAMQMQQQQHANQMEEIAAKNNGELAVEDKRVQGLILQSKILTQGKIDVKNIGIENEPEKVGMKTQSAKEIAETKQNLKEQEALPQ